MTRILVLGAHPDDAEFFAGGFLVKHSQAGSVIRMVSVTNGQSGHQSIPESELIAIRKTEAENAGQRINASYITGPFHDGSLQPSLELRHWIIQEIREFAPDLVLTHRPFDYHPDHRAVGQAVQDASYMVMVPKVVPEVERPSHEPVVAYMVDLFTRPSPFRADVVMDVSEHLDTVLDMLACHQSQVFDWLPWIEGIRAEVPTEEPARREWLKTWFLAKVKPRAQAFWKSQVAPTLVEAFEISEYAGKPSQETLKKLFFQLDFCKLSQTQ
jgi:LmbE family N-acetylglucosaminyl deacetylase